MDTTPGRSVQTQNAHTALQPKEASGADEIEMAAVRLATAETATTPIKKSPRQLLSLWSGVLKETSLVEVFLRPFPLIAYPAVLWGTLACKFSERHRSEKPKD